MFKKQLLIYLYHNLMNLNFIQVCKHFLIKVFQIYFHLNTLSSKLYKFIIL